MLHRAVAQGSLCPAEGAAWRAADLSVEDFRSEKVICNVHEVTFKNAVTLTGLQ